MGYSCRGSVAMIPVVDAALYDNFPTSEALGKFVQALQAKCPDLIYRWPHHGGDMDIPATPYGAIDSVKLDEILVEVIKDYVRRVDPELVLQMKSMVRGKYKIIPGNGVECTRLYEIVHQGSDDVYTVDVEVDVGSETVTVPIPLMLEVEHSEIRA